MMKRQEHRTGLRMTLQRRVILGALKKTTSHPTAPEIYEAAKRELPRISLGTVYRNLDILSKSGLARKLEFGSAQHRFDARTASHYHIRCVQCGRVDDVPIEPISTLEEDVRKRTHYEIIGHQLEFLGLCPRCKENRDRSEQTTKITS